MRHERTKLFQPARHNHASVVISVARAYGSWHRSGVAFSDWNFCSLLRGVLLTGQAECMHGEQKYWSSRCTEAGLLQ